MLYIGTDVVLGGYSWIECGVAHRRVGFAMHTLSVAFVPACREMPFRYESRMGKGG